MKRKMNTLEPSLYQLTLSDPIENFYKSEEAKRARKRYEEQRQKASQPHHDPIRQKHKQVLKKLRERSSSSSNLSITELRLQYRDKLSVGEMGAERISIIGTIDEITPLHPSSSVQIHIVDETKNGIFLKAIYHYYDNSSQYDSDIADLKIGDKITSVGSPFKRQTHKKSSVDIELIVLKFQKSSN